MAQPLLAVDPLGEALAALWEKRWAIDENYLPLRKLKKNVEALMEQDPRSRGQGNVILAFIFVILWEREKALKCLEIARSFPHFDAYFLLNSSTILRGLQELSKAADWAEAAVLMAPADPDIILNVIECCLEAGRWRQVPAYFAKLSALKPDSVVIDVTFGNKIVKFMADNDITDAEVEELQEMSSRVLRDADVPCWHSQIELIDDSILVTRYLDKRRCDSACALSWTLAEKMAAMDTLPRIWNLVAFDFIAAPAMEDLNGGSTG